MGFLYFLDGSYPTVVNVRVSLTVSSLLPVRVHRTAEASDSVIALIVQFTVLYSERVEERPYLFVRPFDDWRDKKRLISPYAADGMFLRRIGNIDFVYSPLSRSATFLRVSLLTKRIQPL